MARKYLPLSGGGCETCAHGAYQGPAPGGQAGDVLSTGHCRVAPFDFDADAAAPQAAGYARDFRGGGLGVVLTACQGPPCGGGGRVRREKSGRGGQNRAGGAYQGHAPGGQAGDVLSTGHCRVAPFYSDADAAAPQAAGYARDFRGGGLGVVLTACQGSPCGGGGRVRREKSGGGGRTWCQAMLRDPAGSQGPGRRLDGLFLHTNSHYSGVPLPGIMVPLSNSAPPQQWRPSHICSDIPSSQDNGASPGRNANRPAWDLSTRPSDEFQGKLRRNCSGNGAEMAIEQRGKQACANADIGNIPAAGAGYAPPVAPVQEATLLPGPHRGRIS